MALAACVSLAGCAQVGPVQPPSAGVPGVVRDFAAQRSGPSVQLSWTAPTQTSDGVAWKGAKFGAISYQICVWPGAAATAKACPRTVSPSDHALAVAELGTAAQGSVTLALRAQNAAGADAGWSNRIAVPLTPVAPPPTLETATPSDAGVTLRWQAPPQPAGAMAPAVAIYRDNALLVRLPAQPAGAQDTYVDANAPVNQHFTYWLRSTAGRGVAQVESQDSSHLQVSTADVFPPAAPTGLEAVASPTGVVLSWNPSPARDLAGYNVYRQASTSAPSAAWTKLNPQLLPTPTYFDPQPSAPGAVQYAVSAVDHAGNESPRSAPAGAR